MTFSGRQLRGKQLTNFKKSNTNSWRFFNSIEIKGVLKFPPSELNRVLVEVAEKQFIQVINAAKEEKCKKNSNGNAKNIDEDRFRNEQEILEITTVNQTSDVILDTNLPTLTVATRIPGNPDILNTVTETPLEISFPDIDPTAKVIKSINLPANTDKNISNDNTTTSSTNTTSEISNPINPTNNTTTSNSLLIPHTNIPNIGPIFLTTSSINDTIDDLEKTNILKEENLRSIEYAEKDVTPNNSNYFENVIVIKAIGDVANLLWSTVVNTVKDNSDIMKLFSLHEKRNLSQSLRLAVVPPSDSTVTHTNDSDDKDGVKDSDGILKSISAFKRNVSELSCIAVVPQSDSKSLVTCTIENTDCLNSLKDDSNDDDTIFPQQYGNNVDNNVYKNNNTNKNNINVNIEKNNQMTPHPPSLSKPSIKSIHVKQRNINPPKKNEILKSPKIETPGTRTGRTTPSPTPPLEMNNKRPNRNNLYTKPTTKQQKIVLGKSDNEENNKIINFEDYENLKIAREFKQHLMNNGHRIPHFLQNIVTSNIVPIVTTTIIVTPATEVVEA